MILTTVAVAIILGVLAQVVAERLKVPAILPLLAFGILAGPQLWPLLGYDLPGLVRPDTLGHGLEVLIHLGIALILFEGGLSLDPRHLRRVGGAVRNLLTLGMAITGVGAAWLAHATIGMPWSTAALFGAIVTVTGPTVIAPLLRHMVVPRRVATVLTSEGLIIDPIGAVLAYLVLQAIERPGLPITELAAELVFLVFIGGVFGFAAGSAARLIVGSRRAGGAEVRNLIILALLIFCYLVAEATAPQSGILAAVVMGFTMAAADIPDLVPLKSFKGQLTVLLISLLFVLLAAQLDLQAVIDLGWRGVVVVAGLILLVRPLAVFASVRAAQLDGKERSVLALTAPRGIVAAAVASLAARSLAEVGIAGGPALEGLVYLTIIVTGLWATAMAVVLPRVFGYAGDPRRRVTVLVGAHPLAEAIALALRQAERAVAVIDSSVSRLRRLRDQGIETVRGDARDAASFEQASLQRDAQVLAITANDELNLLVAELVRDEFQIEHPVVALQRPPEEFGTQRRAWVDLLGGRAINMSGWNRRLEANQARVETIDLAVEGAADAVRALIESAPADALALAVWTDGVPSFRIDQERIEALEERDAITLILATEKAPAELAPFLAGAGAAVPPPGAEGALPAGPPSGPPSGEGEGPAS